MGPGSTLWLAALLGCGTGGKDTGGGGGSANERVACSTDCPDGTAVASLTSEEILENDAFLIVSGECQTVCEPVAPCVWPNVPTVVSGASGPEYACAPLENFVSIPDAASVDLSWVPLVTDVELLQADQGIGGSPTWQVAADIDGDGDDDIVTAYDGTLAPLFSDGLGGFAPGTAWDAGFPTHQARAANLDGVGADELIVRMDGADTKERFAILTSGGDGTWTVGADLIVVGGNGRGPYVEDLDGDGVVDVVGQGPDVGGVFVLWGAGGGSFGAPQVLPSAVCGTFYCNGGLGVAELDGAGGTDIVSQHTGWANAGGRTFTEQSSWAQYGIEFDSRFAYGDGDGDGVDEYRGVAVPLGCLGATYYGFQGWVVAGDLDGDGTDESLSAGPECEWSLLAGGVGDQAVHVDLPGQGHPVLGDFGPGLPRAAVVTP